METGFDAPPSFDVLHGAPIENVAPSIEQFVVLEAFSIVPLNANFSIPPQLLLVNDPEAILPLYVLCSSSLAVTLNVPLVISKTCGLEEEEGVPCASKVSVASAAKQSASLPLAGSVVRKLRGLFELVLVEC